MSEVLRQSALDGQLLWLLLAIQIAMGGFDIVVHHELSERLAWRANAADELKLHAVRNLFYAFLFALFAWVQPQGYLALAVVAILVAEVVITLQDFVEEDRTRKLPATERVLHTLLAINYGAILALVVPILITLASAPTAAVFVSYGVGSAVLMVASLGCLAFAMRDFSTSARAAKFLRLEPTSIAGELSGRRSLVVTGGTGFVGRHLVESLVAAGHDVTVATRDLARAGSLAAPVRLVTSLEQIDAGTRVDAIVDLAGEAVAGGPWTTWRRREIVMSRLRTTRAVNRLVARLDTKPEVVVTASAIGAYGLRGDEALTEADAGSAAGEFTARVCLLRERAALRAGRYGVRVALLRIGLVLDRDGGMLARMIPAFDLALGGRIGSGRQWMSWITLADLVRSIAFVVARADIDGPINATAPAPVTNAVFAKALAGALNRLAVVPVPGWPLRALLGGFARELLLGGQRVIPARLSASGFAFTAPTIEDAMAVALRLGGRRADTPRSAVGSVAATGRPVIAAGDKGKIGAPGSVSLRV